MIVYIMRGLPGSGKDHTIQTVIEPVNKGMSIKAVSADDFFVHRSEYRFDPLKLGEAHAACMSHFLSLLTTRAHLIVVNNTNTKKWEYEHYRKAAVLAGYQVEIVYPNDQPRLRDNISVGDIRKFAARNTHGVPLATIANMALYWENE